jgi:branched-chain amino acid aminotransferase
MTAEAGGGSARPGHVWVDGRSVAAATPVLTAFDRGFQLGDGIFETLRARGGRPTELVEHAARLGRSAAGLAMILPDDIEARLAGAIDAILDAEGLGGPDGDASVRITVSRGAFFGRGLLPPDEHPAPTIVVQAWPVSPVPAGHLENGLHLVPSTVRRDPENPLSALKTTSRADYVFARVEAREANPIILDAHQQQRHQQREPRQDRGGERNAPLMDLLQRHHQVRRPTGIDVQKGPRRSPQ